MVDALSKNYEWIVVTGALGAFGFGWGTGSNDVANAFGTSVGAKTLTLKQAVLLACIFEFTGAIVLGRVSAETIAGGIAKSDTFKANAPAYAYGMSIVLWLGFLWQAFASYMGWNVSATHSIIGGIIGFAMCWGGTDSVFWAEPDSTKIPPIKGVVPIILSWFVSPVLTGAVSALFYGTTRFFILRSEHSSTRACYVLPGMVLFTVFVDIYFVFTKGAKKSFSPDDNWNDDKSAWVSFVIAVVCTILSGVIGIPYLRSKLKSKQVSDAAAADQSPQVVVQSNDASTDPEMFVANSAELKEVVKLPDNSVDVEKLAAAAAPPHGHAANKAETWKDRVMRGVDYDIHAVAEEDPLVAAIHANAEVWNPDTEYIFGFLQVISAICVIFAHGAGEVGYMAGPLAVIVNICANPGSNVVTTGKKTTPEIWVILIGAFGLVIGLATYGYKVCAAVGTQLAKITPSRGFSAELATSFTIMIAAQYGLPTSSSQCITGGIIGIAMFEGSKGINTRLLAGTALSWVFTMVVMGLGCALIFAQGVYSPNRFVELGFSSKLGQSYAFPCSTFLAACGKGQYLKGCGLVSQDPLAYSPGQCQNCSAGFTACRAANQYLSGCSKFSAGTCANCTAISKCAADEYLSCGKWDASGGCKKCSALPDCPQGSARSGCGGGSQGACVAA